MAASSPKSPAARTFDGDGFRRRAALLCTREGSGRPSGAATSTEVLMISSVSKPGLLILPGGGVDPGELACVAAVREAYEEAGVDLLRQFDEHSGCKAEEPGCCTLEGCVAGGVSSSSSSSLSSLSSNEASKEPSVGCICSQPAGPEPTSEATAIAAASAPARTTAGPQPLGKFDHPTKKQRTSLFYAKEPAMLPDGAFPEHGKRRRYWVKLSDLKQVCDRVVIAPTTTGEQTEERPELSSSSSAGSGFVLLDGFTVSLSTAIMLRTAFTSLQLA